MEQVSKYPLKVWNGMAHPIHVNEENMRWWMERCGRRQLKNGRKSLYVAGPFANKLPSWVAIGLKKYSFSWMSCDFG